MRVKVKKLHPDAKVPRKAYPRDLGYDLYALMDIHLQPFKPVTVPTGISVELPEGWGAFIKDRSSLALKGIHTLAGVIDGGYRGEIKVVMVNLTEEVQRVRAGERIAQMVPIRIVDWPVVEVEELERSVRGERGFGSSNG